MLKMTELCHSRWDMTGFTTKIRGFVYHWDQMCHTCVLGSSDLLSPMLAPKNEQQECSNGKSRWAWLLMANQSSLLLRWEQVPLQWSWGGDGKGGEGKRHEGGSREKVSKIKCNRVEKTKKKFNHIPTRTQAWPTQTRKTEWARSLVV